MNKPNPKSGGAKTGNHAAVVTSTKVLIHAPSVGQTALQGTPQPNQNAQANLPARTVAERIGQRVCLERQFDSLR
jgi:hypothetical protein